MKGLLLRLSGLDADAENAVRVIGFFDRLIAGRASPRALVRATATLAECPAGLADPARGVSLRSEPGAGAQERAVREFSETGRVWLERAGTPLPLDDIVLERFAIAAAVLLENGRDEPDDAALVELVLSADAAEVDRSRALRTLRFEPAAPLHVLAVAGTGTGVQAVLGALGRDARAASPGRMHAVLTREVPAELERRPPHGARIGVGPALPGVEAPEAWRRARAALRFTTLGDGLPAVVRHDRLGGLAAVAARLRPADIAEVADVAALDRLAAEPHGDDVLEVLVAFCATGSTRKAAARVHRHHSTIAARLAQAERHLGFSFHAPGGRLRLELALLLRHLRDEPG
ncbi:helix-turn-helix domain-containing protein [Actinomadura opuntiae]|uniref:helix-turn-helix domain-containing protein n=1 Tax=Actinomadura sp. OS1-43 TaxID=604315 RepID=UPI00255B000F|nr:helix-turn-helix domain-containing protein [Actinomadura sp. OS1-43]MDL4821478.1 helix-turn-helix domain-containing protein [Actinomadura sp. OS1-43]